MADRKKRVQQKLKDKEINRRAGSLSSAAESDTLDKSSTSLPPRSPSPNTVISPHSTQESTNTVIGGEETSSVAEEKIDKTGGRDGAGAETSPVVGATSKKVADVTAGAGEVTSSVAEEKTRAEIDTTDVKDNTGEKPGERVDTTGGRDGAGAEKSSVVGATPPVAEQKLIEPMESVPETEIYKTGGREEIKKRIQKHMDENRIQKRIERIKLKKTKENDVENKSGSADTSDPLTQVSSLPPPPLPVRIETKDEDVRKKSGSAEEPDPLSKVKSPVETSPASPSPIASTEPTTSMDDIYDCLAEPQNVDKMNKCLGQCDDTNLKKYSYQLNNGKSEFIKGEKRLTIDEFILTTVLEGHKINPEEKLKHFIKILQEDLNVSHSNPVESTSPE